MLKNINFCDIISVVTELGIQASVTSDHKEGRIKTMSETDWYVLGILFCGLVIGLIYLIKYVVNQLRQSSASFDSLTKKITSEKGKTILGWVSLLIGIAGIITGISFMMDSAESYGMSEANYGLVVAGGIFGGAFFTILGIAVLSRNRSSGVSSPDKALHSKLESMQTMPPEVRSELLSKASAEYSADIHSSLQAERTKKAVIKGAVVGGVIGGDAGAVVGAMAAKEKASDSAAGASTAKNMVKGAVVGGVIGGKAGAVIGAAVAKEKAKKE